MTAPECAACGDPIPHTKQPTARFCCRTCNARARQRRHRGHPEADADQPAAPPCHECGGPLPPTAPHYRRYCCEICRRRAEYRRAAQRRQP